VPDFATHLRYESDLGHIQLSSIVRTIGYRPTGEAVTRRAGWGMSASTVFHPWAALFGTDPLRKDNPNGLERSRILLQYTFGWGIGRYIQDTAGLGLDGEVDPLTGSFETLYAAGLEHQLRALVHREVAYQHHLFRGPHGQRPRPAGQHLHRG
jgi:hypothetical protein